MELVTWCWAARRLLNVLRQIGHWFVMVPVYGVVVALCARPS